MNILPETSVLLAFSLAALVVVLTPGPDMTFFLGKTLTQGRSAGVAAYLGASLGLLFHTAFAAFGLSALLAASANAFLAVKVAGAAYLLWLAIDAIRNGSALSLSEEKAKSRNLREIFIVGAGINLLNPKIILFFVTFLPQFVSVSDPGAAGKLMFLGLYFIMFAIPLCLAIIFAADRVAATAKRSPRVLRIIDWLTASIFAAFAVRILLEPGRG